MLGLPIAVEITPADAPREHVAVLLSACSRALADSECLPAAELGTSGAHAVAIVTWHGDRRVVVEVGLRKADGPIWRKRSLDFERADSPLERWRTIGLVVGTLARREAEPTGSASVDPDGPSQGTKPATRDTKPASQDAEPANRTRPEPERRAAPVRQRERATSPKPARKSAGAARPEPASEIPEVRPPESSSGGGQATVAWARAALDFGAAVGPGLEAVRAGALVRGRFALAKPLSAVFTARYLERPMGDRPFGGRWFTGAAGVGAGVASGELELSVVVDARAEYFRVSAGDDQRDESQGRWLSGLGASVTGGWMPTRDIGFFLGAEGAWMFGTTEVVVQDESVAADSALQLGVEAGLRLRLW